MTTPEEPEPQQEPAAPQGQVPYPQAGGYPPPGAYPPPPGYVHPQQVSTTPPGRADLTGALRWSWDAFSRRPLPMMVPGLLMLLVTFLTVVGVIAGLIWMIPDSLNDEPITSESTFNYGGLILLIVIAAVGAFATMYLQGGVTSGVLKVADGKPVSVRDFLVPSRPGPYIGTVILTSIVIVIGLILLVIPGILAIFALQYAPVFVLDQKMSPIAAMKASARLAFAKKGDSVLVLLLHYVYSYVGSLAMGLGMIVTLPAGEAFLVHCYRRLTDRPIPPGIA